MFANSSTMKQSPWFSDWWRPLEVAAALCACGDLTLYVAGVPVLQFDVDSSMYVYRLLIMIMNIAGDVGVCNSFDLTFIVRYAFMN